MPRPRLTLLFRSYCHLCDEMRDALVPIAQAAGREVVELDVDADPALEAAYGERVPVLLLGEPAAGVELCHFHLDAERVRAALAGPD
jgi:thiol-disulfide isomerase/thioredoxin